MFRRTGCLVFFCMAQGRLVAADMAQNMQTMPRQPREHRSCRPMLVGPQTGTISTGLM